MKRGEPRAFWQTVVGSTLRKKAVPPILAKAVFQARVVGTGEQLETRVGFVSVLALTHGCGTPKTVAIPPPSAKRLHASNLILKRTTS